MQKFRLLTFCVLVLGMTFLVMLLHNNVHHKHNQLVRRSSPIKKIAFMFLLQGAFPTTKIWEMYFSSAPQNQLSIYVHLTPGDKNNGVPVFFRPFVLHETDRRATSYCTDLVSATISLLTVALKDISNEKFILMSPTHIPVKSFPVMYDMLFRDDNSWVCFSPVSLWTSTRPGRERPKHHQWFVLSREHAMAEASVSHPQIKAKSGCHDETWLYPPHINLTEETVRVQHGRYWPGVNDGILRTRGLARVNGLLRVNTTFLAPDRIRHGVSGRCSVYVYWSCGWCNMSDHGASATSPFTAIGPYWGNTSVGKRHELTNINYCLLEFLKNGTDFLFARKIFGGATVAIDCIHPGKPSITVEAALRMLRVLP